MNKSFLFFFLFCFCHSLRSFRIDLNSFEEDHIRDKILAKLATSQHELRLPKFKQRHIKLMTSRFEDKALVSYYGEILVGNPKDPNTQKFMMLFDTGSSEFFIPSESCASEECKNHNKYRFSKSFKQIIPQSNLEYISGTLEGPVGQETVILGEIRLDEQRIHLGNKVSIPILLNVKWDGILGLSFSDFDSSVVETKQTVLDTILKRKLLKNNFFTYYMEEHHGSVSFGEIEPEFRNKSILWVPLSKKKRPDAWTIEASEIKLSSSNKESNSITRITNCLVDTGTFLTYIPRDEFEKLFKNTNYLLKNCEEKQNLPDILFSFKGENGKNVELILEPEDYVLTYKKHNQQRCVISIAHDDVLNDTITLGQVFLKSFFTVFEFGEKKIGFVPLRESKVEKHEGQTLQRRFRRREGPSHSGSHHTHNHLSYYRPFYEVHPQIRELDPREKANGMTGGNEYPYSEVSRPRHHVLLHQTNNPNEKRYLRLEKLAADHRFG